MLKQFSPHFGNAFGTRPNPLQSTKTKSHADCLLMLDIWCMTIVKQRHTNGRSAHAAGNWPWMRSKVNTVCNKQALHGRDVPAKSTHHTKWHRHADPFKTHTASSDVHWAEHPIYCAAKIDESNEWANTICWAWRRRINWARHSSIKLYFFSVSWATNNLSSASNNYHHIHTHRHINLPLTHNECAHFNLPQTQSDTATE